MKQLTVLSGKGGTGKTSLTAAFASLAGPLVLADCDVDAADLHLLCRPKPRERQPFLSGGELVFDAERCRGCGRCAEVCRFEAIRLADGEKGVRSRLPERPKGCFAQTTPDPFFPAFAAIACEGCGCCVDVCDWGALKLAEATVGELLVSDTPYGPMAHGRLRPGAENSGKLVAAVRQQAHTLAEAGGHELILTDGPPGIGCPVIASLTGADGVLAVTEPSVSALHDLTRVLDLADHFEIPAAVLINKCDVSAELADRIESLCRDRKTPLVGRIPFDRAFVDALVDGRNILEHQARSPRLARLIHDCWHAALDTLDGKST